jgi:hypothetical protein
LVPGVATTKISSTEPFVAKKRRAVGGTEARGAGENEVLRLTAREQDLHVVAEVEVADRERVAVDDHLVVGGRCVPRFDGERIDPRVVDPLAAEGGRTRSTDGKTFGVDDLGVAADGA